MTDESPFEIKDGKITIDERKTVSPYNRIKNFEYAKLPAFCRDCVYRSKEAGGNGKCPKYNPEEDAICVVREDFQKFLGGLNITKGEDLKLVLDVLGKLTLENIFMYYFQAGLDGNIPDKNVKTEVNTFIGIAKIINELAGKIVVSETKEYSKEGDIEKILRELKYDKELGL